MQLSKSRYLVRYEVTLKAFRGNGVPLKMLEAGTTLDVVDLLKKAVSDKTAIIDDNPDEIIKITRVEVGTSIVGILFRRRDANAAAPVWEHVDTEKLRKAPKQKKEQQAISAHMFVELNEIVPGSDRYRVVVEDVPGLPRTTLFHLFKKVLRKAEYPYSNEHKIEKNTHCVAEFAGVPSEDIGSALGSGSMPFVELARPPDTAGMDSALVAKPETMRVYLRAKGASALPIVSGLQAWAQAKGWKDFRVQVKTGDGRSKLVPVPFGTSAATALFVKGEYVTLAKALDACTSVISSELQKHATTIIGDPSWT
jgi:hypothetical protein